MPDQNGRHKANKAPRTPPKNILVDPQRAALLQSVRIKVSKRDEEEMRKLRSTMMEYPGSGSSNSTTTSGLGVASGAQRCLNDIAPRRSSSSGQASLGNHGESSGSQAGLAGETEERTPKQKAPPPSEADFYIAVIGHKGVGKSTFIRRALKPWGYFESIGNTRADGHLIATYDFQIQPGGKLQYPWRVEVVEMDVEALNRPNRTGNIWPSEIPPISGVIVCYDSMRRSTLQGVDELLGRYTNARLPTIVLACRSDPDVPLEVDPIDANAISEPYNIGLIVVTEATTSGKGKMVNGLRWLLYRLEQQQQRTYPRADRLSTEPLSTPSPSKAAKPKEALTASASNTNPDSDHAILVPNGLPALSMRTIEPVVKPSLSSGDWMKTGPLHRSVNPKSLSTVSLGQSETGIEGVGGGKEDDLPERTTKPVDVNAYDFVLISISRPMVYLSLEDIFKLVFTAIVSTKDETLVGAFFMTYRRFCSPQDVMTEFRDRFIEADSNLIPQDIRHWTLIRMTGALIDWTSRFPGDLRDLETQSLFREVLAIIIEHHFMGHLSVDLVNVEHSLGTVVDVDMSWSSRVPADGEASTASASNPELLIDGVALDDDDSSLAQSEIDTPTTKDENIPSRDSSSSSSLGVVNDTAPRMLRKRSGWELFASGDSVENSPVPLTHGTSRLEKASLLVLESDPRVVAAELTGMQWELFKAVRPRDVLRHDLGKEQDTPVSRSIDLFNRISRWTTTLILANGKPKHRARTYERFAHVARYLRRSNDYETLYAVISGMRDTSIQRLSQTIQLVQIPPEVEKDLQSYVRLFDPGSGYHQYRRAIQVDLSIGRRAIPLLTTILGLISRLQTVRPADKGEDGLIQWDKFLRFGEILSIITECQGKGCPIPGGPSIAFRRIFDATPIIANEDALFRRSKMLEPAGGGGSGEGNVFRRLASFGL